MLVPRRYLCLIWESLWVAYGVIICIEVNSSLSLFNKQHHLCFLSYIISMFLSLHIRYWLTQEERVWREHSRRPKLSWGWYIGANRWGVMFEMLFRWRERDNRTELALLVSLIAAVVKCAKITRAWQPDPNTSSSSSSPWEPACQELRKRRARFNWALKLHSHLVLWLLSGTPHTFTPSLFLTHSLTHVFIQAPRLLLRLYWKEKSSLFWLLNKREVILYCQFVKQFCQVFFLILLFVCTC